MTQETTTNANSPTGFVGIVLIALGVLIGLVGLFMDGSAEYSEVLNIGLLNEKTNLVLTGGFLFLGGIILNSVNAATTKILARLP